MASGDRVSSGHQKKQMQKKMKTKKLIRIGSLWSFLGEDYMRNGTLVKIESEKPEFTVICDTANRMDKNAMVVKWGRKKMGYVNADDTRYLVPLMKNNRCRIQFSHIVWPHEPDSSAVLKCTAEVDMDLVAPTPRNEEWESVRLTAIPVHIGISHDELELAVNVLYDHMNGTATKDDMTPDECIEEIELHSRFDMSQETTELLNTLCVDLEMFGTPEALRLQELVEAASTHRRGRRHQPEMKAWIEELMSGEEAHDQFKCYQTRRKLFFHVPTVSKEQMANDLKMYEDELLSLPFGLGELMDDPVRLLHAAYYKGITREMEEKVISELVLRNSLAAPNPSLRSSLPPARGKGVDTLEDCGIAIETVDDDEAVEPIVMELTECFFGDAEKTEEFLGLIESMKPTEITATVNEWVKRKLISEYSSHRTLWSILHSHGLYRCTESNWNRQVM